MQSKPIYKADSISDTESLSMKVLKPGQTVTLDDPVDEEIEARRKKLEQLYRIGKATRVGDKAGELPPKIMISNEYGEVYDVSVFQKAKQMRPDIHMRIIS